MVLTAPLRLKLLKILLISTHLHSPGGRRLNVNRLSIYRGSSPREFQLLDGHVGLPR